MSKAWGVLVTPVAAWLVVAGYVEAGYADPWRYVMALLGAAVLAFRYAEWAGRG